MMRGIFSVYRNIAHIAMRRFSSDLLNLTESVVVIMDGNLIMMGDAPSNHSKRELHLIAFESELILFKS
jgi:hypothetical protein